VAPDESKEEEEHDAGGKGGITTGVVEGGNRGASFFFGPYIKCENIIIIIGIFDMDINNPNDVNDQE
jgi:hypothetical protein